MLAWVEDGVLVVEGDSDGTDLDVLATAPAHLDLTDLDLDLGVAVARWVTALRLLRDRHGSVVITGAPQMLAHTLYKVGDLDRGFVLIRPRVDEPTTAN